MMPFVLDCSVTMAWCFEEEHSSYAPSVLRALADHAAIAPSLWSFEVANVLAIAVRKGRLTEPKQRRFLDLVACLRITIVPTTFEAIAQYVAVADRFRLSAYDAAYLDLAMREQIPLATLDQALRAAAKKADVELFEFP